MSDYLEQLKKSKEEYDLVQKTLKDIEEADWEPKTETVIYSYEEGKFYRAQELLAVPKGDRCTHFEEQTRSGFGMEPEKGFLCKKSCSYDISYINYPALVPMGTKALKALAKYCREQESKAYDFGVYLHEKK